MPITQLQTPQVKEKQSPLEDFATAMGILNSIGNTYSALQQKRPINFQQQPIQNNQSSIIGVTNR